MGWFFTKAALLTFGGAYAVLPYVYQGAVETHQWLSGPQMIDGLALGETTPGPLIMVVAFVGFVGGWLKQVLGPDALFLGGALAATVVTFFTFLPSFVFILAGGPLVEATHGKLGFTAPLSAITAAVVGVILNLAMFFAYHVLWPQGFGGRFDALSAVIARGRGRGAVPLQGRRDAAARRLRRHRAGGDLAGSPARAEGVSMDCTPPRPAVRPGLWPRGRSFYGDAAARRGPECTLPAWRHRRLAGSRQAADRQA